ncbi:hypothetical protein Scep_004309 [Stephania cephalantha]|uniref:C2 domain-containing protein n=1 Tax=Stephania cephalantha TaxID=152367 RepID=A0AAP0PWK2_9MAGN
MTENCSRKLIVEVSSARNLMPKDGQGTASAYVLIDYDGQRRRTKTKFRDLNPQWDEKHEFLVHDPNAMATETLELNIYNDRKTGKRSTFLGKVKLSGSSFAKSGSESFIYYPLEKRSVFSQIKGEIGLKVYFVDEELPPVADAAAMEKAEAPASAEEAPATAEKAEEEKKGTVDKAEEKKEEEKKGDQEKASLSSTSKDQEEKPPEYPKPDEAPAAPATPSEVKNPPIAHEDKAKTQKDHTTSTRKPISSEMDLKSLSGSDRSRSTYDLVDRVPFLFVRVLKAKHSNLESIGSCSTFAKLVIGTHNIRTKRAAAEKDWDQVFAFDKEGLNSTALDVSVWIGNKETNAETGVETVTDSCLGNVSFDVQEVPKRVPPDSPLAPQWYTLEGSPENSPATDVMLAVWIGTQTDEAFQEAWQSDSGGLIPETRAKVYLSPNLWYLRLTVIQTQDLQLDSGPPEPNKGRSHELYVKAQLGAQIFKTARSSVNSSTSLANQSWNEDLVFIAAEPFEPFLVLSVEDVSNGQSVGQAKVHIPTVERRIDDRTISRSQWFNLFCNEKRPYTGRIHVRVCLEGGYHVLDEAAHVTSDVQAASKQLSKPPIGLLEVGIRGATNLLPVKFRDGSRGTTDAYVVAKYGPKWVRTRTILDQFNPNWQEQHTWDVHDQCTVLTIGVFDNGRYKKDDSSKLDKDARIGKLRIRLSTLETNRVYINWYPLTVLQPSGARRMGEIQLAIRFSCSSWMNLLHAYASPMLPRMHYVRPLGTAQQDILRHTAMKIVTVRLARSEPSMGHEVVQYMLDTDMNIWSMRRSKANWFRVVGCLSRVVTLARWLDEIRTWSHPPTTVLVHVLLMSVVLCPHLILPTVFMYAFFIIMLKFRNRPRGPTNADPRLSYVDVVGPDELDEEMDGFPTARSFDQVRVRYDRLRALAGRAQTLLGDVAAQGERVEALFNWRDPRATGIFVVFCLFASLVFYLVPFKAFVLGAGFYYLRHPKFRDDMPSVPINFFKRLPSYSDQIL